MRCRTTFALLTSLTSVVAAIAPTISASVAPSLTGAAHGQKAVCAQAPVGRARCFAHVQNHSDGVTPNATTSYTSGYAPADLVAAYSIPRNRSKNTIAIVDAFASPTAQADLNTYRTRFGWGAVTIKQVTRSEGRACLLVTPDGARRKRWTWTWPPQRAQPAPSCTSEPTTPRSLT